MHWDVFVKMRGPDQKTWHWGFCCRVESLEMLGIVERALKCHQEIKTEKHEDRTPQWAERFSF